MPEWTYWRGRPQGQYPGHDEGAHQCTRVVGIGEVGVRGGVGHIGQNDAHRPLGRPGGLIRREPAGEERRREVAGHEEDPVQVGEGEMAQDHTGLVQQQIGQGGMRAEPAGGFDHAGHEDILEIGGFAHDDGQRREQAGDLCFRHSRDDGVLAAGECPVERGPGEGGLTCHVVDGRLGQPLPRQASQCRIDDPHPCGRAIVSAQVVDGFSPSTAPSPFTDGCGAWRPCGCRRCGSDGNSDVLLVTTTH